MSPGGGSKNNLASMTSFGFDQVMSPRKITATQLVSHYMGLGNVHGKEIRSPKGKITNNESSGKFQ